MELKINAMVEHKLSPDEYVYLYYLVTGMICPVRTMVSLELLEKKGFIKITENKIVARQKSIDFLLGSELSETDKPIATSKSAKNKELVGSVDDWIQEWRELFPAGIKSGGYPVRSPKSGCATKMKFFIKSNKEVTKEMIFSATKKYVAERALKRYEYMTLAHYFISKNSISLLEGYIEQIEEGESINAVDTRTNNLADDI